MGLFARLFGQRKTFAELMKDYDNTGNRLERYKILQKAAKIARDDYEKAEVVVALNQVKQDLGLRQ